MCVIFYRLFLKTRCTMKTLKCDLCDVTAQGETFEEWMNNLKPHYMEAHTDVMKGKEGQSPEEMKTEMGKWMAENKARFDAA
ncbi:MAG: hypothetical protein ACI9VM_000240 [Candidatus Azotimanducaceae bacterium]|jgi:hypothetical protein